MSNESIFQYTTEKELVIAGKPEEKLLAADSWLVKDGYVRALDMHRQRFFSSCMELAGTSPDILNDFWNSAIGKLPVHGFRVSNWPEIYLAPFSRSVSGLRLPLIQRSG